MEHTDKLVEWETDEAMLVIEQAKDKIGQILEKQIGEKTAQATLDADNVVTKALEEAKELKDNSEGERSAIINGARDEAQHIVEDARKTKDEAERIITEAEQQVNQIVKEAHEKSEQQSEQLLIQAKEQAKKRAEELVGAAQSESEITIANARKEAETIETEIENRVKHSKEVEFLTY